MGKMVNLKRFSSVAIAAVLVFAIAASLWFASPSPVKALNISFPSLPSSGTLGGSYSFTVKVDVEAQDLLPIYSVNLELYNVSYPTTYKASCTNLPVNTGSKPYTSAETGGGAVTISASTAYGWGYASSGSRKGYGYREPEGLGWHDPLSGNWGYGYALGGYQGVTSITYTIVWEPPSGWPEGTYKAKTIVYGNGSKKFSGTSVSFSLAAPISGVGGWGGGVGAATAPGVTRVSSYVTDEGIFTQDVTAKSPDAKVELTIAKDTIGKTQEGARLSEITLAKMIDPPTPPAQSNAVCLTYYLGPDSATFNPPITLTFAYDPANIPPGVSEQNLVIAMWDKATGNWVNLVSTVDPVTKTISAKVSHFTPFTVIAYTSPAAFTASALTISPAEVNVGESVTISLMVNNTGDLTGSYRVSLRVDSVVETQDVTLAGKASQKVTFTITKDTAGIYTVNVDGLAGSFMVKPPVVAPIPVAFTTSALTISPAEVNVGESVTISLMVNNTGNLTGSYKVTLRINNVAVESKDVTLAGKASQKVTFTTTKDTAGTYAVNVDGLSGTFKVVEAPVVVPAQPVNWLPIAGGIIGVIVILLIILLVLRRRAY